MRGHRGGAPVGTCGSSSGRPPEFTAAEPGLSPKGPFVHFLVPSLHPASPDPSLLHSSSPASTSPPPRGLPAPLATCPPGSLPLSAAGGAPEVIRGPGPVYEGPTQRRNWVWRLTHLCAGPEALCRGAVSSGPGTWPLHPPLWAGISETPSVRQSKWGRIMTLFQDHKTGPHFKETFQKRPF